MLQLDQRLVRTSASRLVQLWATLLEKKWATQWVWMLDSLWVLMMQHKCDPERHSQSPQTQQHS